MRIEEPTEACVSVDIRRFLFCCRPVLICLNPRAVFFAIISTMSEGLRETFIKYLTGFVLVLIVIGGLVMMYPNYRRSESLKHQNAELQARIDRKKAEIAKLAENQRRFRSDADFVEAIARQNHRVFPGELVFIFDKE